jgi:hypothetical protein
LHSGLPLLIFYGLLECDVLCIRKRHTKCNSLVASYISRKFLVFGVLGSSSSSDKGEDGSACDVVDVVVLVDVEIIIDVVYFPSS